MTSDLDEAIDILRSAHVIMPCALVERINRLLARHPEPQKLLPCPWELRGDQKQRAFVRRVEGGDFFVECNCGARGPHVDTESAAIAAWNRRTP